jgi:ABC-type branched-subunit amino acid transport system ATPase component
MTAGYGRQPIIFDVSVACEPGTITAMIGPNGAGKSTLLKAVFGIATVNRGTIRLKGELLPIGAPDLLVRAGVAYVPQVNNVFPTLTVRENLEIGTYVRHGHSLQQVLDLFPDLSQALNKQARKLSGGQRSMLAVGRALMSDPQVLLLDEPSGGLSPILASRLWEALTSLAGRGVTTVVVEQNVKLALEFSDVVYLLVSGRNKVQGRPSDLASRYNLEEMFLEAVPD